MLRCRLSLPMGTTMASGASLGEQWRARCRQQVDRLRPLPNAPAARRRIERLEQQFIDRLSQGGLPLEARAIAFRSIMELRACTARELADFLSVDPRVVVMGLSLLEVPPGHGSVAPGAKAPSRARPSRSKVA
jgi:hypothetical protein